MIYLTGATNPGARELAARNPALGMLAQPGNTLHREAGDYAAWAADNGCFAKGDDFDLEHYLGTYLPAAKAAGGRLLFATAPDVVGDYEATTRRSVPVMPAIRALGIPVAYVAQNGMEDHLDAVRWDTFDVLFIGGDNDFKLGPAGRACIAAAKAHGKWIHMGRVNSWKRLSYAAAVGCDSADGTFLAFGPDANLPRLESWLDRLGFDAGIPADNTHGLPAAA